MRCRCLFRGHVQGVGFRATSSWIARGFHVTGYVRNLPDGQVELVADGPDDQVEVFLQAVRDELGGYIRGVDRTELPPTSEPEPGFTIRH